MKQQYPEVSWANTQLGVKSIINVEVSGCNTRQQLGVL